MTLRSGDANFMPGENEWLDKSEHDLFGARKMMRDPDPIHDLAAFLAQQSAELALKGFLEANEHPFPKIHDIAGLLEMAVEHDSVFATFYSISDRITRYAVSTRYPEGGGFYPTSEEVAEALDFAAALLALVKSRLAEPFDGSQT